MVAAAVVGSILTLLEHVPLGIVARTMATYAVPFVVSLVASLSTSKRLGATQRRSLS